MVGCTYAGVDEDMSELIDGWMDGWTDALIDGD